MVDAYKTTQESNKMSKSHTRTVKWRSRFTETIQGDHSGCDKPPVDIKTKDPFEYEMNREGRIGIGQESKTIGHCRDVLKVVTCLQSSLGASPHTPTQRSNTSLKMRNKMLQVLVHPSNARFSYSPARDQGYMRLGLRPLSSPSLMEPGPRIHIT